MFFEFLIIFIFSTEKHSWDQSWKHWDCSSRAFTSPTRLVAHRNHSVTSMATRVNITLRTSNKQQQQSDFFFLILSKKTRNFTYKIFKTIKFILIRIQYILYIYNYKLIIECGKKKEKISILNDQLQ